MLKEKVRELEAPLDAKNCKWRNLLFDKDGNSYPAKNTWDTQVKAVCVMNECLDLCISGRAKAFDTARGLLRFQDYAWSMQIPIMEPNP